MSGERGNMAREMLGSNPFESAWLKWAMAVVNAKVLEDNIATFASRKDLTMDVTFGTSYDARRRCISLIVAEVASPFPVLWGVLLGEVAHDFRCCLDHIAWALYKRGQTPNLVARKERLVSWPIYPTRKQFNKSLDRKLPGVSRSDRAIVRHYQPFTPGESRADRHVFTVLNDLANADKHRAIQPVIPLAQVLKLDVEPIQAEDCIIRRIRPGRSGGTLKPGAEAAQFFVKKTGPNPRLGLQPHFTLVPAIHELLTLDEFFLYTINATRIVLSQFADQPESAKALVGAPVPPLDDSS
jgi:hypothetical protein